MFTLRLPDLGTHYIGFYAIFNWIHNLRCLHQYIYLLQFAPELDINDPVKQKKCDFKPSALKGFTSHRDTLVKLFVNFIFIFLIWTLQMKTRVIIENRFYLIWFSPNFVMYNIFPPNCSDNPINIFLKRCWIKAWVRIIFEGRNAVVLLALWTLIPPSDLNGVLGKPDQ